MGVCNNVVRKSGGVKVVYSVKLCQQIVRIAEITGHFIWVMTTVTYILLAWSCVVNMFIKCLTTGTGK